jgi:prephenate dehydratase
MTKIIAYQGEPGANSHIACDDVYPGWDTLPCASFEEAFSAITEGRADLGASPTSIISCPIPA